jgi:hypothetical protein
MKTIMMTFSSGNGVVPQVRGPEVMTLRIIP